MIKCVIWDLDETLWQGTLRNGDGVILLPAVLALIRKLDGAGIMQSIVSRNDQAEAMKQLEIFGIAEYFLYPQINYLSKIVNLNKVIASLNIYSDAVVFIDDNEFETSQVNYFLPQITTINRLADLECMMQEQLMPEQEATYETLNRRRLMKNRRKRQEELEQFKGTNEDFLLSCAMKLEIRRAKEDDLARILELSSRTNQLNSFKKKLTEHTVQEYFRAEKKEIFVCRLKDRFGDHGIVGVCFIEIKGSEAVIKQFCISCRIEGRGIGYSFLAAVLKKLQELDQVITVVYCNYFVNEKNASALYLLKSLRFQYESSSDAVRVYRVALPQHYEPVSWLSLTIRENETNG